MGQQRPRHQSGFGLRSPQSPCVRGHVASTFVALASRRQYPARSSDPSAPESRAELPAELPWVKQWVLSVSHSIPFAGW